MSSNPYINAIRPRTLFLAFACAICGNALALFSGTFNIWVCILTILMASSLQILSNLANDYGDFQHGTDTTGKRIGPVRALQSGAITPERMKLMMVANIAICFFIGIALLTIALPFNIYFMIFFGLGVASVFAAIKYTAGKNPYGYRGLGDLFSFIFFGLVAIVGTYFLQTNTLSFLPWLPAIGFGLPTAAVLNVNNMRDMENDQACGKITLPIMLGYQKAKLYHAGLTIGSFTCFALFSILYLQHWYQYLYLLVFIIYFKLMIDIFKIQDRARLDPYLKFTAMTTFLLGITFSICINI